MAESHMQKPHGSQKTDLAEFRANYLKQLGEDHIAVFRAGTGPYCFCITRHPLSLIFRIQEWQWSKVELVKAWRGSSKDLQAVKHALTIHHLRGNWFAASPEVEELIAASGDGVPAAPRKGGRRLNPALALEIYRAAHSTSQSHAVIGRHYGVSAISVGKIARGQVYPAMFERTAPDARGNYYVWERGRDDAPRYRFQLGRRSTK